MHWSRLTRVAGEEGGVAAAQTVRLGQKGASTASASYNAAHGFNLNSY